MGKSNAYNLINLVNSYLFSLKLDTLIKSGGGTDPMKPGNQRSTTGNFSSLA